MAASILVAIRARHGAKRRGNFAYTETISAAGLAIEGNQGLALEVAAARAALGIEGRSDFDAS